MHGKYIMTDAYRRVELNTTEYQCGCRWEYRNDETGRGDVLFECPIHSQATIASVIAFERKRTTKNKW